MKVLVVIENIDEQTGGGATERARQLANEFTTKGNEVSLITTDANLYNINTPIKNINKNIKIEVLRCILKRFYLPYPRIFKINKIIKDTDFVHIINHWTALNILVFFLIKLNKKKYSISPLGSLSIFGRSKIIKRIYNVIIGKKIISSADLCIVATENEIPELLKLDAMSERIVHIPNGINLSDYEAKEDPNFLKENKLNNCQYLLFVGRLNRIKGPDLLLQAFLKIHLRYPELKLVFIGPDEGLLDELKEKTKNSEVSNKVHFLGYVTRKEKSIIIHNSKFLVVPSRKEAMSIVVLEAGIAGKPALMTDQCGFDVLNKINGGLIVTADINGIANGLIDMLDERTKLDEMGHNLKQKVLNEYLWSKTAENHLDNFKRLIN
jgi:glycosyltransferase involved in cell wall biosynthesis